MLPAREGLLRGNVCAVWVQFYDVIAQIDVVVVWYSNSVQVYLYCLVYLLVAALSVDVFVFRPGDLANDDSNSRVVILFGSSRCVGVLISLTVLERRRTLTLKSLYACCSLRNCIPVREQGLVLSYCGNRAEVFTTVLQSGVGTRLLLRRPWHVLLRVPPQTRRLLLLSF